MDWAALEALYPIIKDLASKSVHIKKWLEKRAVRDDPVALLYLELLQSRIDAREDNLKSRIDAREDNLRNAIVGAMLANPGLDELQVKARLLAAMEVAKKTLEALRL